MMSSCRCCTSITRAGSRIKLRKSELSSPALFNIILMARRCPFCTESGEESTQRKDPREAHHHLRGFLKRAAVALNGRRTVVESAVSQQQHFENVQIADLGGLVYGPTGLARPGSRAVRRSRPADLGWICPMLQDDLCRDAHQPHHDLMRHHWL